jgi:hypothetical protein
VQSHHSSNISNKEGKETLSRIYKHRKKVLPTHLADPVRLARLTLQGVLLSLVVRVVMLGLVRVGGVGADVAGAISIVL